MAEFIFKWGVMGAGKSAHLLLKAADYERREKKVLTIKPREDDKGDQYIVSRTGQKRKADIWLPKDDNVLNYIDFDNLPDIILIDEAQFLAPKQVNDLYNFSKEFDITVEAYGLRGNFKMEAFDGTLSLFLVADKMEELESICNCGEKATQNIRYYKGKPVFEGESILIDNDTNHENDFSYDSACGKCYLETAGKIKMRAKGRV